MRIHLVSLTALGLAVAGFAIATPGFAQTNGMNNSAGTNYQNGPSFSPGGEGSSPNTGLQSHESGQLPQNSSSNYGPGGEGSSHNTGLKSHESGQQAQNGMEGNSTGGTTGSSGMSTNSSGSNTH
jgi:hypothetical protein